MKLNLTQKDYGVIIGAAVLTVVSGYIGMMMEFTTAIEETTRFITALILLTGLVFIYRARAQYSGDVARNLEIVGVGLAFIMLNWIPHLGYHLGGHPEWLGLGMGFWVTLFHVWGWAGYAVIAYGFYQFWQSGQTSAEL